MKHRKIEHSEYVPSCLKDKYDACHFGKEMSGTNMNIKKMTVKKCMPLFMHDLLKNSEPQR